MEIPLSNDFLFEVFNKIPLNKTRGIFESTPVLRFNLLDNVRLNKFKQSKIYAVGQNLNGRYGIIGKLKDLVFEENGEKYINSMNLLTLENITEDEPILLDYFVNYDIVDIQTFHNHSVFLTSSGDLYYTGIFNENINSDVEIKTINVIITDINNVMYLIYEEPVKIDTGITNITYNDIIQDYSIKKGFSKQYKVYNSLKDLTIKEINAYDDLGLRVINNNRINVTFFILGNKDEVEDRRLYYSGNLIYFDERIMSDFGSIDLPIPNIKNALIFNKKMLVYTSDKIYVFDNMDTYSVLDFPNIDKIIPSDNSYVILSEGKVMRPNSYIVYENLEHNVVNIDYSCPDLKYEFYTLDNGDVLYRDNETRQITNINEQYPNLNKIKTIVSNIENLGFLIMTE